MNDDMKYYQEFNENLVNLLNASYKTNFVKPNLTVHTFILSLTSDQRNKIWESCAQMSGELPQTIVKYYNKTYVKSLFKQWPTEIIDSAKTWARFYVKEIKVFDKQVVHKIWEKIVSTMELSKLFEICEKQVLQRLTEQYIQRMIEKQQK
ncbi:Hypothetical_protein [Hexamita inflata]|uniref:Hypothetical_protein n=1 Tax=Hexamita inflata TaxID=28002 RepID=A0AA86U3T5_9EUKA|nr:Hypothetical protein HINF_LOCUS27224 [Hexamita inflata]CAI9962875.1 Hypothetical protein HINF_LOCUS50520 [Hexamita inflata]